MRRGGALPVVGTSNGPSSVVGKPATLTSRHASPLETPSIVKLPASLLRTLQRGSPVLALFQPRGGRLLMKRRTIAPATATPFSSSTLPVTCALRPRRSTSAAG